MARLETIKCRLKAIDDVGKVLEVIPDTNIIHVQTTFPDNSPPNIRHFHYDERLEWQDPNFLNYLGKKVELLLVDNVVDKINPLA